jgi:hypothetical protein
MFIMAMDTHTTLLLRLELLFHLRFPVPFAVIDKPVRQLFERHVRVHHDGLLFRFRRVRVHNVLRTHHPALEVLDRVTGQRRALFSFLVIVTVVTVIGGGARR